MGYITVNTQDWREIDEQLRALIMRAFGDVDAEREAMFIGTVNEFLEELEDTTFGDFEDNHVHGVDIDNIPPYVRGG